MFVVNILYISLKFIKHKLWSLKNLGHRDPQFTTNNTVLPSLGAFMDDLSLMSYTVSGAQATFSVHNCSGLGWPRVQS